MARIHLPHIHNTQYIYRHFSMSLRCIEATNELPDD